MITTNNTEVSKNLLEVFLSKSGKGKAGRNKAALDTSLASLMIGRSDTASIAKSTRNTTDSSRIITMNASTTTKGRVDIKFSEQATAFSDLPQYSVKSGSGEYYLSKAIAPQMSEEEFTQAIQDLAKKNALSGKWNADEDEFRKLAVSYISVVSPDRAGIIADAAGKTKIPADLNYTLSGTHHGDDNKRRAYSKAFL